MPGAVLDESVSLLVGDRLKALGFGVVAVAQLPDRGMSDEAVFSLACGDRRLLVTRDVQAHPKAP